MHFRNVTAFLDTDEAEHQSRVEDGRPGKHISADVYMPKRGQAAERARKLDARHQRDGSVMPHDNPSSGVFSLPEAIGA
jgi:hypothetical protein